MKTKSLAIILIWGILVLAAGSAHPGHPWEELRNQGTGGPFGSSAMVLQDDHKLVVIPIFSDFFIWVYIRDFHRGSDHQGRGIKVGDKSYQIIFPW